MHKPWTGPLILLSNVTAISWAGVTNVPANCSGNRQRLRCQQAAVQLASPSKNTHIRPDVGPVHTLSPPHLTPPNLDVGPVLSPRFSLPASTNPYVGRVPRMENIPPHPSSACPPTTFTKLVGNWLGLWSQPNQREGHCLMMRKTSC